MKEIERALKWFRFEHAQQEINYDSHPFKDKKDEDYIKVLETALEVLQSELDRQENKALTLSELKEMVGEPVWDEWYKLWELLIDVDEHTDVDGEIDLELNSGMTYYAENRFYKHKPNGGE